MKFKGDNLPKCTIFKVFPRFINPCSHCLPNDMFEGCQHGSDQMSLTKLARGVKAHQHDTPSDWAQLGLGVTIVMDGEEEMNKEIVEESSRFLHIIQVSFNQIVMQFLGGRFLFIRDENRKSTIDLWGMVMT